MAFGLFVCNTEMVLQGRQPSIFLGAAWFLTGKVVLLVMHTSNMIAKRLLQTKLLATTWLLTMVESLLVVHTSM